VGHLANLSATAGRLGVERELLRLAWRLHGSGIEVPMHASSRNHRFIRQLVEGAVSRPFLNALVAQKRARVERDTLLAAAAAEPVAPHPPQEPAEADRVAA